MKEEGKKEEREAEAGRAQDKEREEAERALVWGQRKRRKRKGKRRGILGLGKEGRRVLGVSGARWGLRGGGTGTGFWKPFLASPSQEFSRNQSREG